MMLEVVTPRRPIAARRDADAADDALGRVYREHYGALVGLARLLVDERGLAEEVVQEAFARTWAGWRRLHDPADPLPYVRRAVVNLARGKLRHRRVVRFRRVEAVPDEMSAEARVVRDEVRRAVLDAVGALPGRQRECVVLRYYLDCSTVETAATLGISEGSVKTHLHRALASLAGRLEALR